MDFISYIAINGVYFLSVYPKEEADASLNWSFILNMIGQFFFLIIIFIAIIFMAVVTLKFSARLRGFSGAGQNLRLMETKALGSGSFVHLVKAGNKYLVLGSSKEKVSMLSEVLIEPPDVTQADAEDNYNNGAGSNGIKFEGMLTEQIKRIISPKAPPKE